MNGLDRTMSAQADRLPLRPTLNAQELVGVSFKHEHLPSIMVTNFSGGFFEVHAENYMGAGGPPHRALTTLRELYPLSIHGVCMSIGGASPLDRCHLERFRSLVSRYEPAFVSEHLAWSSHGGHFFNDLLPLPYTEETLARVCEHIDQVQEAIKRTILIENPSTYVAFASSTMTETEFISAIARRTGCGLLLDINNVFVSATNHRYSATEYLDAFPLDRVGEIHLAGHTGQRDDEDEPLLIDSHDRSISASVWALYERTIARTGPVATIVEWDSDVPEWSALQAQAITARELMGKCLQTRGGTDHAI